MSLFEKYACLYEDTRFTAEEQAEIGEFVVGLMKCAAANDRVGMARHFDKHFAYADGETMSKIGRVCFYFSKYGEAKERKVLNEYAVKEAEEKVAGIGDMLSKIVGKLGPASRAFGRGAGSAASWTASNYGPLMQNLALTAIAAPVVKGAIDAIAESGRLRSSLSSILKNHPELRNDPNVAQYYQMLTTFAPAAAANPLVAGNIMMSLHETGPSFVTPQFISSLLNIQKQSVEASPVQDQINVLAKSMIDVAPKGGDKTEIVLKPGVRVNLTGSAIPQPNKP